MSYRSLYSRSLCSRILGVGLLAAAFAGFAASPAARAAATSAAPPAYTLTDLGNLPGGTSSEGLGVNDKGQVAGYDYVPVTGGARFHAFLSGPNGGALQDLGTLPGGAFSQGYGVNAGGQVAGYGDIPVDNGNDHNNHDHAFLSGPNGGALQDLGVLPGGTYSHSDSVNDSGQVVGTGDTDVGQAAFLYSGGVMTDLNTLIAPGSGLALIEATHISNNGFITGIAQAPGGTHAFLLTPIPVNHGPKITVTARAAQDGNGNIIVSVTTTNNGSAAADKLQITSVTLNGAAPAPLSPSPVPTTADLLAPGHSQVNGFRYTLPPGTQTAALRIVGTYTDTSTGLTGSIKAGIPRLAIP